MAALTLTLPGQLHHTDWDGITFYDMIFFPLFLFIAGVAMPYSLSGRIAREKVETADALPRATKRHITRILRVRRTPVLDLLGMVVNVLFKWIAMRTPV